MSVHEYLDISVATCTILGLSAYSQSRQHFSPMLKGENHDDYDERTWRNKLHTGVDDNGKPSIMVPAHGMQQAIAAAAQRIERTLQMANDMPEDAKRAAYREIAGLRLMEHAGSDRIATKIEKATPADRPMSVAETLRATFANLGIHPRTAKKKAPAA